MRDATGAHQARLTPRARDPQFPSMRCERVHIHYGSSRNMIGSPKLRPAVTRPVSLGPRARSPRPARTTRTAPRPRDAGARLTVTRIAVEPRIERAVRTEDSWTPANPQATNLDR